MFVLTKRSSRGKYKAVDAKYQFGDLNHAKKRAVKDHGKKLVWHKQDNDLWRGVNEHGSDLYIITKEKSIMKKKRSAKQLANDKRLGRMAKARHAKKRGKKVSRKKVSRKKNPDRITDAWLEKRVGLLNDMLGRPKTQYTKKADGGLTGNRGNLFIDHAYGGVKVAEMAGNGTGENNISDGYVPKKELNNFINGMIAAVRLQQTKRNPVKKKTTRKANPDSNLWIVFRAAKSGYGTGQSVKYFNGGFPISNQWGSRTKAAMYRTRGHASAAAENAQKQRGGKNYVYGSAPKNTPTKKIVDHINYEQGKA